MFGGKDVIGSVRNNYFGSDSDYEEYCPFCDNEVVDFDWEFCPKCGTPINTDLLPHEVECFLYKHGNIKVEFTFVTFERNVSLATHFYESLEVANDYLLSHNYVKKANNIYFFDKLDANQKGLQEIMSFYSGECPKDYPTDLFMKYKEQIEKDPDEFLVSLAKDYYCIIAKVSEYVPEEPKQVDFSNLLGI